ncbi:gamma-aminobutyric acid receptor subunit rho-2-like [Tropilaelaps mercedesae]|uniref:Gamma-aminobutyric acid receptor subunit rho-2-like n=1 Tax=Tropilaelaps mercedesae TaxID=418985 RepID=A0A1V9XC63_9ACAR|nr:gamma-aminobutyric acid receptor subunit rho-2-like [Tropilaelaps mercedesae]
MSVNFLYRVNIGLLCRSNFWVFPFDWPRCMMTVSLNFDRDAHLKKRMAFNFRQLTRSSGFRVQGAHLTAVQHSPCLRTPVTSSFMAFWVDRSHIPPMTSARCIIGMMTRLGFTAISSNLRAQLPVQSDLMALNVWEAICLIFIYISLLETCTVTYLERTATPEDSFDRKLVAKQIEYLARTVLPTLFFVFNVIYFAIFIWIKHYERKKSEYCPIYHN